MQMADPDSEGVITLPRFLEVVKMLEDGIDEDGVSAAILR